MIAKVDLVEHSVTLPLAQLRVKWGQDYDRLYWHGLNPPYEYVVRVPADRRRLREAYGPTTANLFPIPEPEPEYADVAAD